MPRKNPMPESEKAICRRLRGFRLSTKLPLAAFAQDCGVKYPTYASYEHQRVPLRYEVFRAVRSKYLINPYWLATGEGQPGGLEPYDDSNFFSKVKPRAFFSAVFEEFLSSDHQRKVFQADGALVHISAAINDFWEMDSITPGMMADLCDRCPKDFLRLGLEAEKLARQIKAVIASHSKKKPRKSA